MDVEEIVTGNTYTLSLPDNYVRVDSMVDLYQLKGRRKKFCIDNLEFKYITIILYSTYSDRWFSRELRACLEAHLRPFVKKLRVYMPEEFKCSESELKRRETLLMIEYTEGQKDMIGRETKLKLLRDKLKTLKT